MSFVATVADYNDSPAPKVTQTDDEPIVMEVDVPEDKSAISGTTALIKLLSLSGCENDEVMFALANHTWSPDDIAWVALLNSYLRKGYGKAAADWTDVQLDINGLQQVLGRPEFDKMVLIREFVPEFIIANKNIRKELKLFEYTNRDGEKVQVPGIRAKCGSCTLDFKGFEKKLPTVGEMESFMLTFGAYNNVAYSVVDVSSDTCELIRSIFCALKSVKYVRDKDSLKFELTFGSPDLLNPTFVTEGKIGTYSGSWVKATREVVGFLNGKHLPIFKYAEMPPICAFAYAVYCIDRRFEKTSAAFKDVSTPGVGDIYTVKLRDGMSIRELISSYDRFMTQVGISRAWRSKRPLGDEYTGAHASYFPHLGKKSYASKFLAWYPAILNVLATINGPRYEGEMVIYTIGGAQMVYDAIVIAGFKERMSIVNVGPFKGETFTVDAKIAEISYHPDKLSDIPAGSCVIDFRDETDDTTGKVAFANRMKMLSTRKLREFVFSCQLPDTYGVWIDKVVAYDLEWIDPWMTGYSSTCYRSERAHNKQAIVHSVSSYIDQSKKDAGEKSTNRSIDWITQLVARAREIARTNVYRDYDMAFGKRFPNKVTAFLSGYQNLVPEVLAYASKMLDYEQQKKAKKAEPPVSENTSSVSWFKGGFDKVKIPKDSHAAQLDEIEAENLGKLAEEAPASKGRKSKEPKKSKDKPPSRRPAEDDEEEDLLSSRKQKHSRPPSEASTPENSDHDSPDTDSQKKKAPKSSEPSSKTTKVARVAEDTRKPVRSSPRNKKNTYQ